LVVASTGLALNVISVPFEVAIIVPFKSVLKVLISLVFNLLNVDRTCWIFLHIYLNSFNV